MDIAHAGAGAQRQGQADDNNGAERRADRQHGSPQNLRGTNSQIYIDEKYIYEYFICEVNSCDKTVNLLLFRFYSIKSNTYIYN
jgi:hypothetical protein